MNLIKTSLLNAVAVAIKMVTLLGINKALAIYVGPSGYAALGQFQSAVQMICTFAGGAINTGVTKYTAEYHENTELQRSVWRTAGSISLIGAGISSIVLIVLNEELASWFLKDKSLGSIFVWFALTLTFFVFNTLILAILNGKKEIKQYISANIVGSLCALIVTVIMTVYQGFYGALVALAIYQSLSFIVTLWIAHRCSWFKLSYLIGSVNSDISRKLLMYAAMALTSAACVPLTQILIRDHIGSTIGWEYAGYWEAINRLSNAYLMLITMTFTVYFLPRLSELTRLVDIREEIINGYKLIIPLIAIAGTAIYLLRDTAISLLFSEEFFPMRDLFLWQLIGDFLKVGSWMIAYLMVSKAMIKTYISLEILTSVIFVILTQLLMQKLEIDGVVVAYAITYLIYWLLVFICTKHLFIEKKI